jgi:hypothetical protein
MNVPTRTFTARALTASQRNQCELRKSKSGDVTTDRPTDRPTDTMLHPQLRTEHAVLRALTSIDTTPHTIKKCPVLPHWSIMHLRFCYKMIVTGKGKVVPVLNLAACHEGVLGEWSYSSTHSLISALDGGGWSASRAGRFTSRERAPDTHWIWGEVGPRAVLDAVLKRKIHSPRRELNPRSPIVQPVV